MSYHRGGYGNHRFPICAMTSPVVSIEYNPYGIKDQDMKQLDFLKDVVSKGHLQKLVSTGHGGDGADARLTQCLYFAELGNLDAIKKYVEQSYIDFSTNALKLFTTAIKWHQVHVASYFYQKYKNVVESTASKEDLIAFLDLINPV